MTSDYRAALQARLTDLEELRDNITDPALPVAVAELLGRIDATRDALTLADEFLPDD